MLQLSMRQFSPKGDTSPNAPKTKLQRFFVKVEDFFFNGIGRWIMHFKPWKEIGFLGLMGNMYLP